MGSGPCLALFFVKLHRSHFLISLFNLGRVDELTLPHCISRFIERPSWPLRTQTNFWKYHTAKSKQNSSRSHVSYDGYDKTDSDAHIWVSIFRFVPQFLIDTLKGQGILVIQSTLNSK